MANVLVIDDDPGTLETFGVTLRQAGHLVCLAATGFQGLALAGSQELDIILADLRLPDSSGLEFLAETRGQGWGTPVVIITAFATPAIREASHQLGAADLAEKPIDAHSLLELVTTHAARRPSGEKSSRAANQ